LTQITVQNCELRIIRHGGWSWGPDPDRLLQAAVRGLPDMIGRRLADALSEAPDGTEARIERMTVDVPARLMELVGVGARFIEVADVPDAASGRLELRLAEALAASLASGRPSAQAAVPGPRAVVPDRPSASPLWNPTSSPPGGAVGTLIASWLQSGDLTARLRLFSQSALEQWYAALAAKARSQQNAPQPDPKIDAAVAAARDAAGIPPKSADRQTLLRARIVLAAIAAGRLLVACDDPGLIQSVERAAAPAGPPADAAPAQADGSPSAPPPPRYNFAAQAEVNATHTVSSALPFLMLGILSRIGYFSALSATLEALSITSLAPVFGAALAFKVLDPPERGWRRTPASVNAASVFAGIRGSVEEPALMHCSRLLEGAASPLNAHLAGSMIQGYAADQPLILTHASGALLLADGEGAMPIAWAKDFPALRPILTQVPAAVLLVPRAIAAPELLRQLHEAHLSFVIDAAPVRGERWRTIGAEGARRYWTNDNATAEPALLASAAKMSALDEACREWWKELALRPAAPLAADGDFEKTLALAAGVALGMIAWTLWADREPVSPALAMQRLGSLDARVRFLQDRVQVRLPLGKRLQDLKSHRLLANVDDVPWYGGRFVEFAEG
jgi:hypothetical protein